MNHERKGRYILQGYSEPRSQRTGNIVWLEQKEKIRTDQNDTRVSRKRPRKAVPIVGREAALSLRQGVMQNDHSLSIPIFELPVNLS